MNVSGLQEKKATVKSLGPALGAYFPTVKEMKAMNLQDKKEKFMPLIIYLSLDPLNGGDEVLKTETQKNDYKETVLYAQELCGSC